MLNCIIDGNYILSKLVFTLHKNNVLYGSLAQSLDNTISNYRKWFPFSNIYLVSDSKEKSWRKSYQTSYKTNRKKDSNIDWNFVYNCYDEFKSNLKGVKTLQLPTVEGDDWISFLTLKSNERGESNLIISNDHDIKQLIKYDLNGNWINIMANEMFNKEKIFVPNNYQIFLNKLKEMSNSDDIFNLNDSADFINLFERFLNKSEIHEINNLESLIIKIVSGDSSDNIPSVYSIYKNGRYRGIGTKGAKTICDTYFSEFGETSLNDELIDNLADIICEKKKLSKTYVKSIHTNIVNNIKLIDLNIDNIPIDILNKMELTFNDIKNG